MPTELALAGVDVTILERRATADLVGTRARGFHARTIEILDQRGIADRFLVEGRTVQVLSFGSTPLDISGFPSRHPYTLGLDQGHIERILLGWVEELGVPVRRGVEVVGFVQDDAGVDVHLADGEQVRTAYLVGADGGRSVVRKEAGIDFVGAEATRSHLVAEVEVTDETPSGIRLDDLGVHAVNMLEGRTAGVVVTEQQLKRATEPTLADLSEALTAVYGTDFGAHDPRWISRFTDATRQAVAYRRGRVLLAGDAAHIHPPTGGQGIGLGVQDAVNLGWKLAQVVQRASPENLLDSYQAERHPATARVLANVMSQAQLQRADVRTQAMRDTLSELLGFEGPRTRLAGLLSGLDVRHDLGEGHPLLGRRLPDLDLTTTEGPRRVFELLHDGRALLLNLGAPHTIDITPWSGRVRLVDADPPGRWELPVIGDVPAPAAVLVRPDGHVAWVGDGTQNGLREALTTWFGPSAPGEAIAGRSGRDALDALGRAYRDYAAAHPGRHQATTLPLDDDIARSSAAPRHADLARAALRTYALAEPDETHAVRLLAATVREWTDLELAGGFARSEPDAEESWQRAVSGSTGSSPPGRPRRDASPRSASTTPIWRFRGCRPLSSA